jgi:hypothetical protein
MQYLTSMALKHFCVVWIFTLHGLSESCINANTKPFLKHWTVLTLTFTPTARNYVVLMNQTDLRKVYKVCEILCRRWSRNLNFPFFGYFPKSRKVSSSQSRKQTLTREGNDECNLTSLT